MILVDLIMLKNMKNKSLTVAMWFIALGILGNSIGYCAQADQEADDVYIQLIEKTCLQASELLSLEELFTKARAVRTSFQEYENQDDAKNDYKKSFFRAYRDDQLALVKQEKTIIGIIFHFECYGHVRIEWLVIHPDYQGKKLAKKIIDTFAKSVRAQTIILTPLNARLAEYYIEKCGFNKGERDAYGDYDCVKEYEA